ncbi:hypothetical protein FACS189437_02130 [Bacteroidia bacterium]|nr:hypothetical protein FACS189437_02130 [Bacteroidia bacterium]
MNRHFIVATLFVLLFGIPLANAQEAFKHWAIGVEGGTNGVGITAATSLSSNFKLRAGVDFLGYTYSGDIDLDLDGYLPENIDYSQYYNGKIPLTGTFTDAKLNFTNFKAIVDYYPMANGIFSISAGLYFGKNTISAAAKIDRYQELIQYYDGQPVFDYEGLTVKPDADGSFDAKVQLGNAIKPYFGIGLGRTIANSRVGFKFDLGLIYQGAYKFKSDNIIAGDNRLDDVVNNNLGDTDVPTGLLKLWPVINFGISYRIF